MKNLFFLGTVCIFTSCASVDQQVFKARQIFDKYPNEAAKYCGDRFPVADSVLTFTIDSSKGKTIDYMPALINLETMLDSAKAILNQKQTVWTDLNGQLTFNKAQLEKANKLINNLTATIGRLKTSYKPCGVDTIKSTYTKLRTNTAKIMALTAQIVEDGKNKQNLESSLQSEESRSAQRLYFLIGIVLLIVIYLAFKVYKFFTGGGLITGIFG